jgi:hypothetical protein
MIKLKNLLAENMRRFKTKNLSEDRDDEEYDEVREPLVLTPDQKKVWENSMIARFDYIAADEGTQNINIGYEAAAEDLPWAAPAIVANILCGFDPLENKYNELGEWNDDPGNRKLNHPYNKLRRLGYDIDDVEELGSELYDKFISQPTNNKKIEFIQKWSN